MHEPCIEMTEKYRNDTVALHPDKYVLPKNTSLNNNKETRPSEEPEWKPIQIELTHLHKYCLKLSKVRLTCK